MSKDSLSKHNWSDIDLTNAVSASRSWRGVMRELGLCVTSTGSIRVVKRRVALLRLDTSHFTGQRTWPDARLKRAAAHACSWDELFAAIGVKSRSGDERIRVKAHALRLGLDLSHLTDQQAETSRQATLLPTLGHLRQVGRRPYSIGNKERQVPYDPELIDWFFIVDGDLNIYLIPCQVVAGRVAILLRTYRDYIVGNAAGLIAPSPHAA